MMQVILYWVSIAVAWGVTALNVYDMRRRRRRDRALSAAKVAEWTGLSKLQVQVALDDGTAAFFERIAQLKPTKGDTE